MCQMDNARCLQITTEQIPEKLTGKDILVAKAQNVKSKGIRLLNNLKRSSVECDKKAMLNERSIMDIVNYEDIMLRNLKAGATLQKNQER